MDGTVFLWAEAIMKLTDGPIRPLEIKIPEDTEILTNHYAGTPLHQADFLCVQPAEVFRALSLPRRARTGFAFVFT